MPKRVQVTRLPRVFTRRRLLIWIVGLALGWLLWSRFAEIDLLLRTLRHGRPLWIGAALLVQALYYLVFSSVYASAFNAVDVRARLRDLVPLTFASIFANSTVTSAGAVGAALFVDDARRRGESAARATAGTVLVMAADYSAYAILLTAGLILLIRQHDLTRLEGFSGLVMYIIILSIFGLLSAGLWWPGGLRRVLGALQRASEWIARLLRRPALLGPNWAARNADEFIAAAATMTRHPARIVRTVAIAMLAHLLDLLTLWLLFRAFEQPVTLSIVIVLYAMTVLFWIVSPTPNGIGIVETVMPVIYTSVDISLEAGTIINLAFRGISFWLPLLIGFFLMRRLRLFAKRR